MTLERIERKIDYIGEYLIPDYKASFPDAPPPPGQGDPGDEDPPNSGTFVPTPGYRTLFSTPGGAIEDWSDAVVQEIATPGIAALAAWRYRAVVRFGARRGLQSWVYITRAPHRWGGMSRHGDVLVNCATSAGGNWQVESRIDERLVQSAAKHAAVYEGEHEMDILYREGYLHVLIDGRPQFDPVPVGGPIALQRPVIRIQWGSDSGEPVPHATNEGSALGAVLFEGLPAAAA